MTERPSTILVTGGAGLLGWHLVRRLESEGRDVAATMHRADVEFDRARVQRVELGSPKVVAEYLERVRPSAIIHTAALTQTQACEDDPVAANRANVIATQNLLTAATELFPEALPYFLFTSTDLVFDGESAPYDETAPMSPVMEYGRTKEAAEGVVRGYKGPWTILRPALMYGPPTPVRGSFLEWIRGPLREGREATLFLDEWRTPVLVADVVEAIARLLDTPAAWTTQPKSAAEGILHCGGAQRLSRWEMGELVARRWGLPVGKLKAQRRSESNLRCRRPKDVSLVSGRLLATLGLRPVGFQEGLERVP